VFANNLENIFGTRCSFPLQFHNLIYL
jgi:hypothetical protein